MVVFSDLDRSIIYSNKFIGNLDKKTYECIEFIDEKEISYISFKTIELMKELTKKNLFIPTTTRTIEQFQRINFSKYDINFPYAITNNGGCILKNNEIMIEWEEKVKEFREKSEDIKAMIEIFQPYLEVKGVTKFRVAEDLFFYIVVDFNEFEFKYLENFINILSSKKWSYYISGRKIYFLPEKITKENAIKFLCEKLDIKEFAVIGDSKMDVGMLNLTDSAYILKHGDIDSNDLIGNFMLSSKSGMNGTECILNKLMQNIRK